MRWLAFALLATPAAANPNCGKYADIAKALSEQYGEAPVERGFAAPDLVEWWANPETGTWTIVMYSAHGNACILVAGDMREAVGVALPGVPG